MKNLYTKLAVDGIKNNSKLYFPYMLSIAGVLKKKRNIILV